MPSLHILDLFAHLIDHGFQVKPDPGQRQRLRFGTQGIRLAHELLHQEIQLAAHPCRVGQMRPRGTDMGGKAVKFFGDVGLDGQKRQFLRQSGRGSIASVMPRTLATA
jgi:hypothetical protein